MSERPPYGVVPISESAGTMAEVRPSTYVVLVVDDERGIADSLSTILRSRGLSVLTAYDGEMALQRAASRPPHLLIADVWMPAMSGVQLALALVTMHPGCKVLLCSGQATRADLRRSGEPDHNFPLLWKPVPPLEMLWHVEQMLGIRLGAMPG